MAEVVGSSPTSSIEDLRRAWSCRGPERVGFDACNHVHDDLRELLAGILLAEMGGVLERHVRLSLSTGDQLQNVVASRVIGSESPKAQTNGLLQAFSTSHAARLAGAAGSSGAIGTSDGNWRAPALKLSSGKGAS